MRISREAISVWRIIPYVIVVFAAALGIGDVKETDVYWHIMVGKDIIENQRFTGNPAWVYGPGDGGWQTTQWLSEVVLALAFEALGWAGIMDMRILLAVGVFVSLFLAIKKALPRSLSKDAVARVQSIFGILMLIAAFLIVQERPQTVSFIFLPWVGLWLLRLLYTGRWPVWWHVGLLVMVWSWLHGGSLIVAPALVTASILHFLIRRRRVSWYSAFAPGVPVVLTALVAPILSPIGWNYYKQAFLIQQAASGRIVEWIPAELNSPIAILWLVLLGGWVAAALTTASRTGNATRQVLILEGAWLVCLLAYSLFAARYLSVAILLAIPLLARRLALALRDRPTRARIPSSASPVVVGAACLMLIVTYLLSLPTIKPVPARDNPERIWSGMSELDGGRRVLVDYNLSGKTMALTSPTIQVSIDGRSDRYGAYLDDYETLFKGEKGWRQILNRDYASSTDAIIPEASPLVSLLQNDGWGIVCSDQGFIWLAAPGYFGACPKT